MVALLSTDIHLASKPLHLSSHICVRRGLRLRRLPEGPERRPGSGARGAAAALRPHTVRRAGRGEAEGGLLAPRPVAPSHSGCPSRRGRDGERHK